MSVLQVDLAYRPLTFCSWKRAFSMVWEGKARILEEDENDIVRSPSCEFNKPLVIQVPYVVKLKPLSDKNINRRVLYSRDFYKCQYCLKNLSWSTATIDHLKPRSAFVREGLSLSAANTYENCVTCCQDCNVKKGDKLPYECGMYPVKTPKKPDYVSILWSGKEYRSIQAKYILQYYPVLRDSIEIHP